MRKLISFDWAIKKIFRSKANFDILEGFLSELLFEDITILEVLESESNKEDAKQKSNRIDIKVKNTKEEILIIEIQYDRELDYLQRILYGTSKVITEHIKEGEPYSKVVKVISINILYFDFGDGDDYIYKGTTSFKGLHNHTELKLNDQQKKLYQASSVEKLYPEYYLIKIVLVKSCYLQFTSMTGLYIFGFSYHICWIKI
jgi:predicted transposase/invertase (TIGR01784 family)